ncbi:MAG: hypothetical protein R3C32_11310 [Chloroflexota bacterium]
MTLEDLGLAGGDRMVTVTGGGAGTQPYELVAEPVSDEGVDAEPNDTPQLALPLDPTSGSTGRLTSDADVDQYLVDLDETLAAGLMDVTLAWGDGSPGRCAWPPSRAPASPARTAVRRWCSGPAGALGAVSPGRQR